MLLGAASQARDADSSRAPGLTSGLQGSVNVHRGALLLVPQWQCISSFVFYIVRSGDSLSAERLSECIKTQYPLWEVTRLPNTGHLGHAQFRASCKAQYSSTASWSHKGRVLRLIGCLTSHATIFHSCKFDLRSGSQRHRHLVPYLMKHTLEIGFGAGQFS